MTHRSRYGDHGMETGAREKDVRFQARSMLLDCGVVPDALNHFSSTRRLTQSIANCDYDEDGAKCSCAFGQSGPQDAHRWRAS